MSEAAALLQEAERLLAARDPAASRELGHKAVAADPRSARAWRLLGMAAVELGEPGEALINFTRAAELSPELAELHARKALCLAQLHRPHEARACADQALASPTIDGHGLDAIGNTFYLLGEIATARDVFARATRTPGATLNSVYNLAVAHQALGDFDAAEACYRQIVAAAPQAHGAWYGLVRLRRQTPERNVIADLEAAFAKASDPYALHHLGHALAKSHEDLGDFAASLDWLDRAKAGMKALFPYDARDDDRLFASAAALAETPRVAIAPALQASPIFIVGMPRSGTTLVERILASHSQVRSVGESAAFPVAAKRVTGVNPSSSVDADTLLALARADIQAVGGQYLAQLADDDRRRTVDKMPLNFLYVGAIRKALPNARIVCLRRNPMDTCLSNYKQLFALDRHHHAYGLDMAATARRFAHFDALARRFRSALPADRYRELSYEALVADPEREIRALLAFCGLAWEDACLHFHEAAGAVRTASSVQVRQPLNASSVGRWRRYGEGLTPLREALEAAGVAVRDAAET